MTTTIAKDDHVKGDAHARVTLIHFADYRCPYSAAAHPVVKATLSHFEGRARYVYRHFPLTELHPAALPLARFAEAAGQQGFFWQAHDFLFGFQREITDERLARFIDELGIDPARFDAALESEATTRRVMRDVESGKTLGVHKTPSFWIDGKLYQDEWHRSGLRDEIAAALEASDGLAR